MGLDNGIYIKLPSPYTGKIRKHFDYAFTEEGYDYYEVCYWRKCWGLRSAIIYTFDLDSSSNRKEMTQNECYFEISRDEIKRVLKVVREFNNKKTWNNSPSIWTYKEIKSNLKSCEENLKQLLKMMKKHEYTVVWVDSY